MESAEAVAAKRRVLVDALMMCLQKSRVVKVVDAKTVRGVIDSASGELWREGEFRLEQVWKLLIAQPGLTAEEVAPPLLVFKAYEKELGVQVRIPQALSAIPRGEQIRLREALGVQRADFAKAIDDMKSLAADEAQGQVMAEIIDRASGRAQAEPAAQPAPPPPSPRRKALAIALVAFAVVAIGFSTWWALRDTSATYDVSDVSATLQLANARRGGSSLTATIVDPKWAALPAEERKKTASAVMDIESPKGVRSLILLDPAGAPRAMVEETPLGRTVMLQ